MSDFPRVTVQGDATGGWLVDIHDGNTSKVYSPEAATAEEAEAKARAAHGLAPVVIAPVEAAPPENDPAPAPAA